MSLVTLGAVLKFAVKIEDQAKEFYENNIDCEDFKNLLPQYEKRIKKLIRVRRENTTEMILEPIKDFSPNLYQIAQQIEENVKSFSLSIIGKKIERTIGDFYSEAAKKIAFLSEVATLFDDISADHYKNSDTIK
ncbi:MAG: hypothetical protein HGN29_09510 [Asgard group archaeon]|nr:hypothetical protein [Asgard group archaeon]